MGRHMEGWVGGLQLFGLSLKDRELSDGLEVVLGRVSTRVSQYLIDEVIGVQPPKIRAFLEATAPLDRFTSKRQGSDRHGGCRRSHRPGLREQSPPRSSRRRAPLVPLSPYFLRGRKRAYQGAFAEEAISHLPAGRLVVRAQGIASKTPSATPSRPRISSLPRTCSKITCFSSTTATNMLQGGGGSHGCPMKSSCIAPCSGSTIAAKRSTPSS